MKALLYMSVGEWVRGQAKTFADRPAFWFEGKTLSYKEMDRLTDRIAAGLLLHGLKKGEHVALWSCNEVETLLFFYALQKAGALAVVINGRLKAGEAVRLCGETDTQSLMIGAGQFEKQDLQSLRDAAAAFPPEKIYWAGSVPQGFPGTSVHAIASAYAEHELPREQAAAISPQDPAMILFTSGTTGISSKAVMYSHFHLVNGGIQKADSLQADCRDVFCAALPYYHIFGIDVNFLAAVAVGACVAIPRDAHSASVLRTVQDAGCTLLSAVPSIYRTILCREDLDQYDLSTLRAGIVGGAYCSPEAFRKIESRLRITLLPGLGQTEVAAGVATGSLSDSLEIRSTTVGHFAPHMEWKIADPDAGFPLPSGCTGEICLRGPMLMLGYYRKTDPSPVDADGWLHSGDLGMVDQDANLHVMGRLKDIISHGGEKILPGEIEDLLQEIPGVAQCKVVGIPDEHYGEAVCACIIPEKGFPFQKDSVAEYLRSRIARFKLPAYILLYEDFPMTGTEKIDICALKSDAIKRCVVQ